MLGDTFDPRRDIDAVAIDIAVVDDDVAHVDADAKFDSAIFGNGSVTPDHGTLDFHRAAHSIDCTCKFDQGTIASSLDDAAAVFVDLGVDEVATARLKRCESAFLVNAHQTAVTGNIGREDSSQPPFDTRLGHRMLQTDRDCGPSLWSSVRYVYRGKKCLSRCVNRR